MSTKPDHDKTSVTATEFHRHPGRYQRLALRRPVTITAHGEPSLVMLSADEYRRLKSRDDRRAVRVEDLSEEWVEALMKTDMDPRHAQLDKLLDD